MSRFVLPLQSVFNINGRPLDGAKLQFDIVGEVTPKDTFSDEALTTPNTNPVIADAAATFGNIFLNGDYDVTLSNKNDVVIWGPLKTSEFSTSSESSFLVADIIASTGLAVGDIVPTTGYTTDGDGGNNTYEIVAAGTGTDDGGSFIDLSGSSLQAKGLFSEGTYNFNQWGATGLGIADDLAAIVAALAFAPDSDTQIDGVRGNDYLISATLELNGNRIEGNNCRFVKDFDGVGINITGGSVFTFLSNFRIDPSASFQPSDFDGTSTSHGIVVTGTRVEFNHIESDNHDGAGFFLDQPSGNMNRSKYFFIRAGGNALAGCVMDGDFTGGADNMSVWEFNGQFLGNFGEGFIITDECPIRQSRFWIHSESNMLGAAFPATGEFDVNMNRIIGCDLWIYSETGTSNSEIRAGDNSSGCVIFSARKNTDRDVSTAGTNTWISGRQHYHPTTGGARSSVPLEVNSTLARVGTSGEFTEQLFTGSGGIFGGVRGEGNGAGSPFMKIRTASDDSEIRLSDEEMSIVINTQDRFRIDDTVVAGETAMTIWDVDTGARLRVTVGADDSGGTGFKLLRIPN